MQLYVCKYDTVCTVDILQNTRNKLSVLRIVQVVSEMFLSTKSGLFNFTIVAVSMYSLCDIWLRYSGTQLYNDALWDTWFSSPKTPFKYNIRAMF